MEIRYREKYYPSASIEITDHEIKLYSKTNTYSFSDFSPLLALLFELLLPLLSLFSKRVKNYSEIHYQHEGNAPFFCIHLCNGIHTCSLGEDSIEIQSGNDKFILRSVKERDYRKLIVLDG